MTWLSTMSASTGRSDDTKKKEKSNNERPDPNSAWKHSGAGEFGRLSTPWYNENNP